MFPAFRQKLGSHLSPQVLQSIQLLIEQLRAAPHAGLWELAQPFLSRARSIDLGAATRNAPASIQCFQSIHHARQIFADGLITATFKAAVDELVNFCGITYTSSSGHQIMLSGTGCVNTRCGGLPNCCWPYLLHMFTE